MVNTHLVLKLTASSLFTISNAFLSTLRIPRLKASLAWLEKAWGPSSNASPFVLLAAFLRKMCDGYFIPI